MMHYEDENYRYYFSRRFAGRSICSDKLPLLESLSFGGGAMLGEIWGKPDLC
jgi:hypothetical protein